jgi:hypothetical protein
MWRFWAKSLLLYFSWSYVIQRVWWRRLGTSCPSNYFQHLWFNVHRRIKANQCFLALLPKQIIAFLISYLLPYQIIISFLFFSTNREGDLYLSRMSRHVKLFPSFFFICSSRPSPKNYVPSIIPSPLSTPTPTNHDPRMHQRIGWNKLGPRKNWTTQSRRRRLPCHRAAHHHIYARTRLLAFAAPPAAASVAAIGDDAVHNLLLQLRDDAIWFRFHLAIRYLLSHTARYPAPDPAIYKAFWQTVAVRGDDLARPYASRWYWSDDVSGYLTE